MVWYNPRTWGRSKPTTKTIVMPTPVSAPAPSTSTPKTNLNSPTGYSDSSGQPVSYDPTKSKFGSTAPKSGGSGGGGGYTTTSETGTGYNPATGVQGGNIPAQQLPPIRNVDYTNKSGTGRVGGYTIYGGQGSGFAESFTPLGATLGNAKTTEATRGAIETINKLPPEMREQAFGNYASLPTVYPEKKKEPIVQIGLKERFGNAKSQLMQGEFNNAYLALADYKIDVPYNLAGVRPNRYWSGTEYSGRTPSLAQEFQTAQVIGGDIKYSPEQLKYLQGVEASLPAITKYQTEVESLGGAYQTKINTGELTYENAVNLYKSDVEKISLQANQELGGIFSTKFGNELFVMQSARGVRNPIGVERVNLAPVIVAGTELGLIATGAGVASLGGKTALYSGSAISFAGEGLMGVGGAGDVIKGIQQRNWVKAGFGGLQFWGATEAFGYSAENLVVQNRLLNAKAGITAGFRKQITAGDYAGWTIDKPLVTNYKTDYVNLKAVSSAQFKATRISNVAGTSATGGEGNVYTQTWVSGTVRGTGDRLYSVSGNALGSAKMEFYNMNTLPEGRTGTIAVGQFKTYGFEDTKPIKFNFAGMGVQRGDFVISTAGKVANVKAGGVMSQNFKGLYGIYSYYPEQKSILYLGDVSRTEIAKLSTTGGIRSGISGTISKNIEGTLPPASMQYLTKATGEYGLTNLKITSSPTIAFPLLTTKSRTNVLSQTSSRTSLTSQFASPLLVNTPPVIISRPTITRTGTATLTGSLTAPVTATLPVSNIVNPVPVTNPVTPTVNVPFNFIPFIPFVPMFPDFDMGGSKRRFKARQPKKYQPSFEALVFNLKGKAPKGIETGLRLRPITKGYSFAFKESPIKFGNFGNILGTKKRRKRR